MKGYMDIPIISSIKFWDDEGLRCLPIRESDDKLVPLSLCPDKIIVSPQYYIQGIDGSLSEGYARAGLYRKLIDAAAALPTGYRFVIYDCWRPLKVQQTLFDIQKDEIKEENPGLPDEDIFKKTREYVAPPSRDAARPTPHNTGGAIDLTIADEKGLALDMGCEFDNSTERARTVYFEERFKAGNKMTAKDVEAMRNRRLLYHIMTNAGFTNYVEEWWHYDYGDQNWAWCSKKSEAIYGMTAPSFPWNNGIE